MLWPSHKVGWTKRSVSTNYLSNETQGFTLIELLIVIFIISLMVAFSLPLTTNWYQTQVIDIIAADIEQAIEEGMQDSIMLGETLRLIPLQNQSWTSGIRLISEKNLAIERTIHLWQWPNTVYHIVWHGFQSNTQLRFTPDLSQAAMNGYFLIENQTHHGYKMIVNRIGRIRVESI